MPRLNFDITADDKASSTIEGVGRKVGFAAGAMASATTFAADKIQELGAAVVQFGRESIDAALEAEESAAKLELTFQKFGNVADVSVGQVEALGAEMISLAGIADEDVNTAFSTLARVQELSGEQILELIPLIGDASIALDQDMVPAAENFTKALLGNTRAAKDLGIDFEDLGSVEANYAFLSEQYLTKVGGTMTAYSETTAGQLKVQQAEWDELKETVGFELLPVMQWAIPIMIDGLRDFLAGVELLGAGWSRFADQFAAGAERIGSWIQWLQDRWDGFFSDFSAGIDRIGGFFGRTGAASGSSGGSRSAGASTSAADSTTSAGTRATGSTYNITVGAPFGIDPARAGEQIVSAIRSYEARNGAAGVQVGP